MARLSCGKFKLLNILFFTATFTCAPVRAYTTLLQVSGAGACVDTSEETEYEESLIKSVTGVLSNKKLDPRSRIEIEVDGSGNFKNGKIFDGETKVEADLRAQFSAASFGALPIVYEPASLTLSFTLDEVGNKKLGRSNIHSSEFVRMTRHVGLCHQKLALRHC
ncbi:MAG: hypothetical protein P4L53_12275 [Candidatus Obscuribacterales bacterium]|nr:hypothetical protein [Candidatus Obscuribacterales bacterium]